MKLVIGYLYGDLMNIYGDTGNVICLTKRCLWRGIEVEVREISIKDKLKVGSVDIFFFGGGQDSGQVEAGKDLSTKGQLIKNEIERGVPLLSICGGYQLLGEYYQPKNAPKIKGVGLFPAYTIAGDTRMIGNIVIESKFGRLVGFENHSGKTFLKDGVVSLGNVISGFGNNGEDKTEGCIYKNAIGCYMHGSLLPKNPSLADWLIKTALEVKYEQPVILEDIEDTIEENAHEVAVSRFG